MYVTNHKNPFNQVQIAIRKQRSQFRAYSVIRVRENPQVCKIQCPLCYFMYRLLPPCPLCYSPFSLFILFNREDF